MTNVFISYSHEDFDFATNIFNVLEQAGHRVWMDKHRLQPGNPWRQELQDALDEANVVVIICTPTSNDSMFVTYEWAYALGQSKLVIPLIRHVVDKLHKVLADLQAIDYTSATVQHSTLLQRLTKTPKKRKPRPSQQTTPEVPLHANLERMYSLKTYDGERVQPVDFIHHLGSLHLLTPKERENLLKWDRTQLYGPQSAPPPKKRGKKRSNPE